MLPFAALALTFGLVACAPAATASRPPGFVLNGDRTLEMTGELRRGSAEELKGRLNAQVRQLTLRGGPALPDEALEVARLVAERGLDVQVIGFCFSDCASHLFISGARKTFAPDAVLGFSFSYWAVGEQGVREGMVRQAYTDLEQTRGLALWRDRTRRELELYAAAGVSTDLLTDAHRLSVAYRETLPAGDAAGQPLWVPTATELSCYGVRGLSAYTPELSEMVLKRALAQGSRLFQSSGLARKPAGVSSCVG